ncbi:MAG: zinc ribbon domain-containing protein [Myxococcales bacterium]|nr:zinc ribbon domain-containing protein [Myxococcales bacterium]
MRRSAIWVRVGTASQGWTGRLVPGGAERIHVHFPFEKGPSHAALGSRLSLGLAQPGMSVAVRDDATLIRVDRRREDALECVLEMDHPEWLLAYLPDAVIDRRTDKRRWIRAAPEADSNVLVPVILPEAPPSAQRLVGRLLDGSAGGVGLAFPMVAEPRLCRTETMRATVPMPGLKGVGEWVCQVRYRALLDDGRVRYGLQFVSDGVAVHPPGPQLESLWDCDECGTEGLLAQTHVHCPQCGAPARGPDRHPSWRELATPDVHPMCGTDVDCPSCGVVHGELARFCGHCGDVLPSEPRAAKKGWVRTR